MVEPLAKILSDVKPNEYTDSRRAYGQYLLDQVTSKTYRWHRYYNNFFIR